MSSWILVQVFLDLILLAGVASFWIRRNRPPQDDPRLSRGLQILQSKISVLEDLSDRTEIQVQQLTALLESKCREIQEKIIQSDQQIQKMDSSMKRGKEVVEIFSDKIPHQEILERQNTIKYIKAARMAHAGKSIEDIAKAVDLSIGELEMIAQVNRDQLMFSEEALPEWTQAESVPTQGFQWQLSRDIIPNFEKVFEVPKHEKAELQDLGLKFQMAQTTPAAEAIEPETPVVTTEKIQQNGKWLEIKPFQFKKIDMNDGLS